MDLKSTKATELCSTDNRFRNTALQCGIVKPSAELKSTYTSLNQFKGIVCEAAVIRLLSKKGWQLQFQRARTEISEIDLIFLKQNKIILVEVKKLDEDWQAFERISKKQFQTLQRNLNFFSYRFQKFEIRAFVAWVNRKNEITFLSLE